MLDKILRLPVCGEVQALLEKIDTLTETDSSYYRARVVATEGDLTWYERKLLKRALSRVARRKTLTTAMEVVLNIDPEQEKEAQYADAINLMHGHLKAHRDIATKYYPK